MDAKERVTRAIDHHETDRIPTGELTIADGLVASFLGVEGPGFPERLEFVTHFGIDAVCESPEWPTDTTSLPHAAQAEWKTLEAWATQSDRFVFALLDGVFGWGPRLLGFEGFLTASLKRSKRFMDLVHGVERLNLALAHRAVEAGADGVLIAEDIAHKQGTAVSPGDLREFLFPSLARQLQGMAPLGIPVFFHSDGNLNAVISDLVEIGFHGFQCLESAAGMDLAGLKVAYGRRVCLWGNLDPTELFLGGSSEELVNRVRDIIRVAAPGGGFIFGTSSGLVDGMRLEKIEAVYRVVSEWASSSRSWDP